MFIDLSVFGIFYLVCGGDARLAADFVADLADGFGVGLRIDCGLITGWLRRPRLLFTAEARSPLAPLKEGGDKIPIKVPLLKGDLGGSSLRYKREIKIVLVSHTNP
ncbi:hypothetical protein C7B67_22035 [filamentous cyanobacterium Phorm 6]|nr:hypothetical protein C7B67_22035 [filamentous cyanobacterium Phorm 6]